MVNLNKEYYRITCNNIGVYEYLKKILYDSNLQNEWYNFIESNDVNWLKKPNIYNDVNKKCYSYFNKSGYAIFIKRTLPLILKWIDKDKIKTNIVKVNETKIIYQDEYQIVVSDD